jgi:hypothetical protein
MYGGKIDSNDGEFGAIFPKPTLSLNLKCGVGGVATLATHHTHTLKCGEAKCGDGIIPPIPGVWDSFELR